MANSGRFLDSFFRATNKRADRTARDLLFLTVFAANTGCVVSNMVVKKGDFCYQKMAIVKQPQIVEKLINTGKIAMQRSRK